MSTFYLTQNQPSNGIYSGSTYVFNTYGGFSINQNFPQINLNTSAPIAQYDVTDAIQLRFSVRTFNEKIGIIKDQYNDKIIQVLYYDVSNETLINEKGEVTDNATITAKDFLKGVNSSRVNSMGKMASLYNDFNYTVMEYFGAPYGFSSVFSNATSFNANNGQFTAVDFVNLINGITFDGINGSVISDLTGQFTVNNLIKHLRFVCATDIFGNRPASGNFGIINGFMPGDLIYVPNGMSITMSVDIEAEPYSPPNNVGTYNLQAINNAINYTNPYSNVKKTTTSSLTNITQTYSVPILIILENEDSINVSSYANNWIDTGAINGLNKKNWLSVSISSLGQYQSIVDDQGSIYISSNYGQTWNFSFNMGANSSNSIGVSENGRYQTASNGLSIFISSDYGVTWTKVLDIGPCKVFISVSLCGAFQTILSCGDSIYLSSNYGLSWTRYSDENSDLYNSIQAFPTGSVSLSFTGQYQAIACEYIYISKDYGQTWVKAFSTQPFNEQNWIGISISSDGKIMTAIENGGNIYNSQDYGVTWTNITSNTVRNKQWRSISISANANFQTAIEAGGTVYYSNDFGSSWNVTTDSKMFNKNWISVSVSANGQYQTIAEYGGSIYTCNLT